MSALPADLIALALAMGLEITEVLHRTDKTLLASGTLSGQRVAVKCLLDPDPFWAEKWRHEVDVYEVFAESPPPLRVPRLLYTDGARLLVLEWVDGQRLDDDRYPQRALNTQETDAVLGCVRSFNQWPAPGTGFEVVFDYQDRFRRYRDYGYLTDADHDALARLLRRVGEPRQVNHGDPLPSNILLDPSLGTTLLDWEYTGLFLPGFDLAMLHTQIGAHSPLIKTRIDDLAAESGTEDAFAVNLAAVLTRELRMHHELPDGPLRGSRLPLIEAAWAHARDRLHQQASRRP
ncbi:phosphotransferase [Polymorphospora rubra]|uniref:phosphotransferase n=1 Tax=Polymorphospora rubra TaxID=338584 RepID=UPI0033C4B6D0